MTDPDLTALAVDAARLVGWWQSSPSAHGFTRCPGLAADTHALALPTGAPAALLLDALLDWCAERGMDVEVRHSAGEWLASPDNMPRVYKFHPTKLGALLLALDAAGVLLEGEVAT